MKKTLGEHLNNILQIEIKILIYCIKIKDIIGFLLISFLTWFFSIYIFPWILPIIVSWIINKPWIDITGTTINSLIIIIFVMFLLILALLYDIMMIRRDLETLSKNKEMNGVAKNVKKNIVELKNRIKEIDELSKENYKNEKFDAWKTDTKICLIESFNEDSLWINNFNNIRYTPYDFYASEHHQQEAYVNGLKNAKELLKRCISKLEQNINS